MHHRKKAAMATSLGKAGALSIFEFEFSRLEETAAGASPL
jgi:hypothetical protein